MPADNDDTVVVEGADIAVAEAPVDAVADRPWL